LNTVRGQIAQAHADMVNARREFEGVKAALAHMRESGLIITDQRFTDMQKEWGSAAAAYSDALSHYAAVIDASFPERKQKTN
jgi:hypothetical protein